MYDFIKTLHGYFGILAVLLLIILFFKTMKDFIDKNQNLVAVRKVSKFTTLTVHIQLLLGILILINNSSFFSSISTKLGSTSVSFIEHFASNLLAIILITVFNAKLKKAEKVTPALVVLLLISILCLSRVIPLIVNVLNK